jgi:4-amino-4-deoxy-L-arabinose transferase-like glycosyltransferase
MQSAGAASKTQPAELLLIAFGLLLAAVIVQANVIASTFGLDSIRMVQAFSLDEELSVARMKDNLARFSLDPDGFFYYGNVYHTVGYYCLAFLESAGWVISTPVIGLVLRLISIISGCVACLSLWMLGNFLNIPKPLGLGAALVLLTMPDFVLFSRTMHPDVLQTLFVIVSLGAAVFRPTFLFALISAIFAGLAFSTKYIGAIVLPFGFLPLAFCTLGRERLTRAVLLRLFLQGVAMIGAFSAVFILTNPYAAAEREVFISTFKWQLNYSATGYGIAGLSNPALWLDPLLQQFGSLGVLYLVAGFMLSVFFLSQDLVNVGWRAAFRDGGLRTQIVLVLFVVASAAHLAISIRQREARFTYHIVPFLILLSAIGMCRLFNGLFGSTFWRERVALALALSLLVFAATQARYDLKLMADVVAKEESEPIKFGNFVAARYPPDTKILADGYTYLPPSMTNVVYVVLQTEQLLSEVAPELIILRREATGASVWKREGTSFADGQLVVDRRYDVAAQAEAYIAKLVSPSSGWAVIRENSFTVLFQRKR